METKAEIRDAMASAILNQSNDWHVKTFRGTAQRLMNIAMSQWQDSYATMSPKAVEEDLVNRVSCHPEIGFLTTILLYFVLGSLIKAVVIVLIAWWMVDLVDRSAQLQHIAGE